MTTIDIADEPVGASRRPSLLRECRLSDGRLAWPVAAAAGMSEATFRGRLKAGLSPDAAVSKPVAKRGPSRAAERAEWAAQRAADQLAERAARRAISTRPVPKHLDASADSYAGVIWQEDDFRLIVSPRGAAYAVQLRNDGAWQLAREFPSAAVLRPWLACVAIDPSPALLKAAAGLPDNPAASGRSPYRPAAI